MEDLAVAAVAASSRGQQGNIAGTKQFPEKRRGRRSRALYAVYTEYRNPINMHRKGFDENFAEEFKTDQHSRINK